MYQLESSHESLNHLMHRVTILKMQTIALATSGVMSCLVLLIAKGFITQLFIFFIIIYFLILTHYKSKKFDWNNNLLHGLFKNVK